MISAKKYITESYIDSLHCFGYMRTENYFFAEPHNIIVSVPNDAVHIEPAIEPKKSYWFNRELKQTQICDVDVPIDFLTACLRMYEIQKENNQLVKHIKSYNITADCDLFYTELESGNSAFRKNTDKAIAIEYYSRALTYKKNDASTLYNLACCHAGGDASRALSYLKQAINQGYLNESHLRTDLDLKPLINNPEFKQIIEDLKEFKSAYQALSFEPYTDEDLNDAFNHLKKATKNSLFVASFVKSFYGFSKLQNNLRFNEIVNRLI
jgi:hypothetical protein